jgi:hypothetical protein
MLGVKGKEGDDIQKYLLKCKLLLMVSQLKFYMENMRSWKNLLQINF